MTKTKMAITSTTIILVGVVGFIIRQEQHPKQQAPDRTEVPGKLPYHFTQQQSKLFIERSNFGKWLGLALQKVAKDNGGQLPPDLTLAGVWLETNTVPVHGQLPPKGGIGVADFELVYNGNLSNSKNPIQTILAREKEPVGVHEGLWNRMYVFADGSVIKLEATTADGFSAREKEAWPGQPL